MTDIAATIQRYENRLHDVPDLRDRIGVFEDRAAAGVALAKLIGGAPADDALILAIPAGGVPVAASLADALHLPLDVAVVSKVTLPWNTEVGCGAVAFDGSVKLNEDMLRRTGLAGEELAAQVQRTREKVQRRQETLRKGRSKLDVGDRSVMLVDDGLASGFTMLLAVETMKKHAAARVVVAVPTAPLSTIADLIDQVDELWCANIRSGWSFAVAEAYLNWYDVSEGEAARLLR